MTIAAEARIAGEHACRSSASVRPDEPNLPGLGLQDPLGMNQVQVMQMVPIAGQSDWRGGRSPGRCRPCADVGWELRARGAMSLEIYQLDQPSK
jgi:hypothetical protein